MNKVVATLILITLTCLCASPVLPQNPFTSRQETQHKAPNYLINSQFFVKLVLWQHLIKQKMSELIRETRTTGKIKPIMFLMMLAFSYGAIHGAGPGHGKFVAMTYVLSHKASILGGLLFGIFIALAHGLSGAVGVLGLRYIIHRGVGETLETATTATQIISFGLIVLLGLGILFKNGYAFFVKPASDSITQETKTSLKGSIPWAVAVGLIPCPAVVMVMLFCISMDALTLGLLLAVCISLGMAATISCVVIAVVIGKAGALRIVSKKRAVRIEYVMGFFAGIAVTIFGLLFLITSIA